MMSASASSPERCWHCERLFGSGPNEARRQRNRRYGAILNEAGEVEECCRQCGKDFLPYICDGPFGPFPPSYWGALEEALDKKLGPRKKRARS